MEKQSRVETIVNESMMVEHEFRRQILQLFPDFCNPYDVRMIDTYLPRIIEHLSRAHTIIDLGSGTSRLELELEKYGIHCVSVEPRWSAWTLPDREIQKFYPKKAQFEIERKNLAYKTSQEYADEIKNEVHKRTVAADALSLPLQDNSVDIAMSHMALPSYLRQISDWKKFFLELKRVLHKKTGEVRLYQFNQNYLRDVKNILDANFFYDLLPKERMSTLIARPK